MHLEKAYLVQHLDCTGAGVARAKPDAIHWLPPTGEREHRREVAAAARAVLWGGTSVDGVQAEQQLLTALHAAWKRRGARFHILRSELSRQEAQGIDIARAQPHTIRLLCCRPQPRERARHRWRIALLPWAVA